MPERMFNDLKSSSAGEAQLVASMAALKALLHLLDVLKQAMQERWGEHRRPDIEASSQLVARTYGEKYPDGSYRYRSPQGYGFVATDNDSRIINTPDQLTIFEDGQITPAASQADRQYLNHLPTHIAHLGTLESQLQTQKIALLQRNQHQRQSTTLKPL